MFKKSKLKSVTKKTMSVLMVAVLTGVFISSSKFNDNSEVFANEPVATSESYEPASFDREYTGENENLVLTQGNYKFDGVTIDMSEKPEKYVPALQIANYAEVHIWLKGENTFIGSSGKSSTDGGQPGILVPENATLFIHGSGSLNVQGGAGSNAENGDDGYARNSSESYRTDEYKEAIGKLTKDGKEHHGHGGNGAGGGGAAIGTAGSRGGMGGKQEGKYKANGQDAQTPEKCGTVYFFNTGKMILTPGEGGNCGKGGNGQPIAENEANKDWGSIELQENCCFEGGGGGGGGGSKGHAFGSGGAGGGGGGNNSTCGDEESTSPDNIKNYNINDDDNLYIFEITKNSSNETTTTNVSEPPTPKPDYFLRTEPIGIMGGSGGGGGGSGGNSNKPGGGGGGGGGFIKFKRKFADYNDFYKGRPYDAYYFEQGMYTIQEFQIADFFPEYKNWGSGGSGGDSNNPGDDGVSTEASNKQDGENGGTYGDKLEEIEKYKDIIPIYAGYGNKERGIVNSIVYFNGNFAYRNVGFGGNGGKGGDGNNGGKGGEPSEKVSFPPDSGTTPIPPIIPIELSKSLYSYDRGESLYPVFLGNTKLSGSEGTGDGGNGAEDVISGTAFKSKGSSYKDETVKEYEDISNKTLSIYKEGSKLKADSNVTSGLCKYIWEIDGASIPVENKEELPLLSSYLGKEIKLISEATDKSIGNLEAYGRNEVTYKFTLDLQDCAIEPTNPLIVQQQNGGKYTAEYTGSKINPDLKVSYGNIILREGTHYTVAYPEDKKMTEPSDDIELEVKASEDESMKDIITNSGDSIYFNYSITAKTLGKSNFTLNPTEFTYNGSDQKPTITGRSDDSTLLKENIDYSLEWEDEKSTDAKEYTVTAKGKSEAGYTGDVIYTYKINPLDISLDASTKLIIENSNFKFTGESIIPKITLTNSIGKVLSENTDYIITWPGDTKSVGEKEFTVTGKGNYKGSIKGSYTIEGTNIGNFTVSIDQEQFEYNRNPQFPNVTVSDTSGNPLEENSVYTITRPQNIIDVGEKEIIINGIKENGYESQVIKTYSIIPADAKNIDVSLNEDKFYYNGNEMIPEISVKYLGQNLKEDIDYTVKLSNDLTSPGEKSITFNFMGNYAGSKTLTYTISKAEYECEYGDGFSLDIIPLLNNSVDKNNMNFYISSDNSQINAAVDTNGVLSISSNSPVGSYNLAITEKNSGITIHVEILIKKATPIVWIEDKFAVYSGDPINVDSPNIQLKNNEKFSGNISYDYYSDEACSSILTDLPRNVGSYYVKAYIEAPNENYNSTVSEPGLIYISKADQILEGSTYYSGRPGDYMYMDTTSNVSSQLIYESEDENIAQVENNGKINFIAEGTTVVAAYAPETENYNDAVLESTVEVSKDAKSPPSSSNFSNSSISGIDSNDNNFSLDEENDNNENNPQGNAADKIWNKILETGDKSIYIITIVSILGVCAIILLILTKRKK